VREREEKGLPQQHKPARVNVNQLAFHCTESVCLMNTHKRKQEKEGSGRKVLNETVGGKGGGRE
jgi:hypothetical protein